MSSYIYENEGVHFRVEYTVLEPAREVRFDSVRVVDSTYSPVGPDLIDLLDKTVVLTNDGPVEGERFLSNVLEELKELL